MPYIAKVDLGIHKKGEVVPKEKAEQYIKVYLYSPVEWVDEQASDNLDINKDGKVDSQDAVLASKVMNDVKKKMRK